MQSYGKVEVLVRVVLVCVVLVAVVVDGQPTPCVAQHHLLCSSDHITTGCVRRSQLGVVVLLLRGSQPRR